MRPTKAASRGYEVARRAFAEMEEAWEREVGPRNWTIVKRSLQRLTAVPLSA